MLNIKKNARTVIFVVSEDWYFLSHRLPQARAVREMGFHVVVATRLDTQADAIRSAGFEAVNISFVRRSLNVFREAKIAWQLFRLIRARRPRVVHAVALKPILEVGIASLFLRRIVIINAFAGLGAVLGRSARPSPFKRIVTSLVRALSRANCARVLVQNNDDLAFVTEQGIAPPNRVFLIPGSGINVTAFEHRPEPMGTIVISMVSRLLRNKGVVELVEATRLLRMSGVSVQVQIVGTSDPHNPHSVTAEEIARWHNEAGVVFLGHRDDIATVWANSHIATLPSYYGEGVPKSLLEAAACGRPIVTTDMPGCRDLVPDGSTGILVPPRDPLALAKALQRLIENPEQRRQMGRNARDLAVHEFADERIVVLTQDVYREALRNDISPGTPEVEH